MTGDSDRHFFDTNVLLYVHDSTDRTKQERAKSLLAERWLSGAALSIQVLQEFYVNATRKLPKPLSHSEAAASVAELATLVIHEPESTDVLAAVGLHHRIGLSFWDAMIVRSASELGCTILWTEDLNAGQTYEGVEARNPFA